MRFISVFLLLTLNSLGLQAQLLYSETEKKPVVDSYHGIEVTDNYQWLELEKSEEKDAWTDAQNELSEKYLEKMVRNTRTEGQMNRFMFRRTAEYEGRDLSALAKNNYYFRRAFSENDDTPNLYYKKGYRGKERILVNAEGISSKDEIVIAGYSTSKDNKYLAYLYSRNGSDWREIKVVEPRIRKHHPDVVETKHSWVYWLDDGFFYKKYPKDSLTGKSILPELRYHQLGQDVSQDKLIFKTHAEDEFLSFFRSTEEDMYVIKKEDFGRGTYSYYFLDPAKTQLSFRPLLLNVPYDLNVVKFKDNTLIVLARIENNTQLVGIPLDAPQKWNILSPQYENAVYKEHEFVGDKIVMSFQGLNNDIICMLNLEGQILKELPMPAGITIVDLDYREEFSEFFFKMQSYIIPPVLTKLNLESFNYSIIEETQVNFDAQDYHFTETTFTSHDGVEVPIFLVYKNTLEKNGNTPFLLKTYGGYNRLGYPSYDPGVVYFIENGGVFAYVHVRGSGKLGNDWWDSGRRLNKKNSYLDFIGAAEFLIEEGFTAPKKIAITGASHGGLVTAAAAVSRPELFGAAVVQVGITDMLRWENFSVGASSTNLYEFGSVKNKEDFENMYSYSPYHNVKDGVNYPAILLVTGTHDNRVPPFHSFKFAARLQNNPGQKNPILLWTQEQTGHNGASNKNDQLQQNSFIYGFLFHELEKAKGEEL